MTSEATNDETLAFFKKFEYFGLPEDQVLFFEQGDYPALSNDGKILMSVRVPAKSLKFLHFNQQKNNHIVEIQHRHGAERQRHSLRGAKNS